MYANDPYDPYEKETLFSLHIRYLVSVIFGSHNRLEAWASFRKIQKISPIFFLIVLPSFTAPSMSPSQMPAPKDPWLTPGYALGLHLIILNNQLHLDGCYFKFSLSVARELKYMAKIFVSKFCL